MIIRLIIVLGLIALLYLLSRSAIRRLRGNHEQDTLDGNPMVQDPVCLMYVPRSSAIVTKIGGQTYRFCSKDCARAFQKQLSG